MCIPPVSPHEDLSCTGADLVFLFDTQVYASLCLATAAEGSFFMCLYVCVRVCVVKNGIHLCTNVYIRTCIKTHGSESRGQEEAGLRDEQVSYLQVAPL